MEINKIENRKTMGKKQNKPWIGSLKQMNKTDKPSTRQTKKKEDLN